MAVQPLNFADMFMNAMEVRRRRQQTKLEKERFKANQAQAKQEAQARQDAVFQKQKAAKADRTANVQRQAAQMIQANPANTERVVGMLRGMMERGEIDQISQITPQEQPQQQLPGGVAPLPAQSGLAQAAMDAQSGVQQPQQQEQFNPKELAEAFSLSASSRLGSADPPQQEQLTNSLREFSQLNPQLQPGTPEFREGFLSFDAQRNAQRRPTTNLSITNATKTKAEGQASQALQDIDKFKTIRGLAKNPETGEADFSQFLTLGAKLQRKGANLLDAVSLPPNMVGLTPAEHEKMQKFTALVQGYRAKKFKDFLGSAQSVQEIANLADSVISMDMSPKQFEQALVQLEDLAESQVRHAQLLLSKGIKQESAEFTRRLDQEFFADKAERGLDEMERLLSDPKNKGMSEERAMSLAGITEKHLSALEMRMARGRRGQ